MGRIHVAQKMFQVFFGKFTCFGQPINGFLSLNVHIDVVCNIHKTVPVDDLLWDKVYGDADILVIVWILKWCPKVVFFNVQRYETGSWCGNSAVQQHLAGCYVCGGCTGFNVSVHEVYTLCQPCTFLLLFLRAVAYQSISINDFISIWDMGAADGMDAVGFLDAASNTLRKAG